MREIKAFDYLHIYARLGINLNKLGCVMMDIAPLHFFHGDEEFEYYVSSNPDRYWIKGNVESVSPHVTLLYGILYSEDHVNNAIDVLSGWNPEPIEFSEFDYFDSPYLDEKYFCIVGHVVKTHNLMEAHKRLSLLPHINMFGDYKPHVTIAYIEPDIELRDSMILHLNNQYTNKGFSGFTERLTFPVTRINYGKETYVMV